MYRLNIKIVSILIHIFRTKQYMLIQHLNHKKKDSFAFLTLLLATYKPTMMQGLAPVE